MRTAVCGRDSPAHADEQLHPMLNARNGHKAHALSPLNRPESPGKTEVPTNPATIMIRCTAAHRNRQSPPKQRVRTCSTMSCPGGAKCAGSPPPPSLSHISRPCATRACRVPLQGSNNRESGRLLMQANEGRGGRGIHRSGNASGWRNRIPPENGSKLP